MQPHQQQGGLGPHPSAARLNDLLEFVKAEFEQVSGESGLLRAQREEYEAMSKSLFQASRARDEERGMQRREPDAGVDVVAAIRPN
jgi:hypothetical protein